MRRGCGDSYTTRMCCVLCYVLCVGVEGQYILSIIIVKAPIIDRYARIMQFTRVNLSMIDT